ncbi:endo alpha-1,4 polygalactosaminidase [Peptoniphilus sp. oral taxon 386]|uniref:endo alpha-1,4 polygalactosaminidase n=1 Tax=Peptoniphilus sp. oral taxon 386 TaxID=652713 RepID=UPI0001DA9ABC|nr:endo alpha-1,4 polygalactosaminidase [Peptoniphilus sp. oral taxon 386]EFI42006.1 hypothetical protein HMPREF0629_00639 [Peptoniphilus sp. oral taxon 386 str. F0131]
MRNKTEVKILSIIMIFSILFFSACNIDENSKKPYGVFIGAGPDSIEKMKNYELIVVDASNFSDTDIAKIHSNGQRVYSYLNIGSIESFRPYYDEFKSITMGNYENWSEERWIDVSDSRWKKFIIEDIAGSYIDKKIDGFFVDNIDVWYEYPSSEIYEGILNILYELNKLGLPIIINGGDSFMREAVKSDEIYKIVDGVNQECVLTSIDFENDRLCERNNIEEINYFKEYLSICKNFGMKVYVLEYSTDKNIKNKIKQWCENENYLYYISESIELL